MTAMPMGSHSIDPGNCGVEGHTDRADVNQLRERQQRNFIATLMLSRGIPLLLAGDEIGRSQQGNNNTYCQDNELSWLNWAVRDERLLSFTRRLIAFRRQHPRFMSRFWPRVFVDESEEIWMKSTGEPMSDEDWGDVSVKALMLLLRETRRPDGLAWPNASVLILFNGHHDAVRFVFPVMSVASKWRIEIDTRTSGSQKPLPLADAAEFELDGRSLLVFTEESSDRGQCGMSY